MGTARHARTTAVLYVVGNRCSYITKLSYGNFAHCSHLFRNGYPRLRRHGQHPIYYNTFHVDILISYCTRNLSVSPPRVNEYKRGLILEPAWRVPSLLIWFCVYEVRLLFLLMLDELADHQDGSITGHNHAVLLGEVDEGIRSSCSQSCPISIPNQGLYFILLLLGRDDLLTHSATA